ncbi:MAG: hypothetical protein KBS62_02500 [Oscillospiraceae bacterium]|nr:hypothetical protein [Candidatus Ruminococcus equi]
MKKTMTRVIATVLSAITMFSVAAVSLSTAGAAEVNQIGASASVGDTIQISSNNALRTSITPSETVSKVVDYILEATNTKGRAILPWGVGKIVGFIFGETEGKDSMEEVLKKIDEVSQKMDDYHSEEMEKLEQISSKLDIQRFVDMYEKIESMNTTIINTIRSQEGSISEQPDQKTIDAFKEILKTVSGTSFAELQSDLNNFYTKIKDKGQTEGFSNYVNYLFQQADKGATFNENADYYQVANTAKSELSKMLVIAGQYAMNINALKKMDYEIDVFEKRATEASKAGTEGYMDSTLGTLKDICDQYETTCEQIDNMLQSELTVDDVTKGFISTSKAWEVASAEMKAGHDVTLTLKEDWNADLNDGLSTNIKMASPENKGFTSDGGLYVVNGGKMTVDLNGHKINMTDKSSAKIFTLADKAKLVVENGIIENGSYGVYGKTDGDGASENVEITNTIMNSFTNGAVYMDGYQKNSLKMYNCKVRDTKNGTAVSAKYKVMYDIEHCTFEDNKSTGNGGAFSATMDYVDGIIRDCKFKGNSAKNGGAVASVKTIDNCTFEGNTAENLGGALYYVCKSIKNCTFINNRTNGDGGAVWHQDDISNCEFIGNKANGNGGGLYVPSRNNKVTGCTFESNKANKGGAVYFEIDDNTVEGCTFNYNHADSNGGAINYNGDDGTEYVRNSTFNGNDSGHNGGAIYTPDHTDVNIYDSTFTNNHASKDGGALYLGIVNTTNHSLHRATLTNNEAGDRGGAIYGHSTWQSTGSVNLHGVIILKDNHKTNGTKDNFYGSKTNCGLWSNKAKLVKCGDFDKDNSIIE